jgi:dethiobiotin synthetase
VTAAANVLVVTGTGTGIGKTVVTPAVAAALSATL